MQANISLFIAAHPVGCSGLVHETTSLLCLTENTSGYVLFPTPYVNTLNVCMWLATGSKKESYNILSIPIQHKSVAMHASFRGRKGGVDWDKKELAMCLICYRTSIGDKWIEILWDENRESEKAGSCRELNLGHLWLEPPVLCHWATTAGKPPTTQKHTTIIEALVAEHWRLKPEVRCSEHSIGDISRFRWEYILHESNRSSKSINSYSHTALCSAYWIEWAQH